MKRIQNREVYDGKLDVFQEMVASLMQNAGLADIDIVGDLVRAPLLTFNDESSKWSVGLYLDVLNDYRGHDVRRAYVANPPVLTLSGGSMEEKAYDYFLATVSPAAYAGVLEKAAKATRVIQRYVEAVTVPVGERRQINWNKL